MNLFEIIREGGFVMYVLLISSLIIWAIAIERVLFYRIHKKKNEKLLNKLFEHIKNNKKFSCRGEILKESPYLSGPYLALFDDSLTREKIEEKVSRKITELAIALRRYLWILATIASISPFVGLFGTVVGIIKAFADMAETGKGGFSVVAAGLSEALIATAAGILVAVVALVFYNYLNTKSNLEIQKFKLKLEDLADYI